MNRFAKIEIQKMSIIGAIFCSSFHMLRIVIFAMIRIPHFYS